MTSDKSQGSVAAHVRCGGLFTYHSTIYYLFGSEENCKIGAHLAMLQTKVVCLIRPDRRAIYCSKMKNWPGTTYYDG